MSATDQWSEFSNSEVNFESELQQALQKISFLKMEQEHLRDCLKTSLDSLKVRSDSVHQLHEELRNERQKNSLAKAPQNTFTQNGAAAEEQSHKLQERIKSLNFEIQTLQDQILTIKRQNADLESNNLSLCESYKFTKEQLVRTRDEVKGLNHQIEQFTADQKEARNKANQMIQNLQSSYEEKMRKVSSEWATQSSHYEEQAQQYRSRLEEQQKVLEAAKAQGKGASEEDIRAITAVYDEKFNYQKSQFAVELEEVENSVRSLEKSNHELVEKLREADEQVWNLKCESESLTSQMNSALAEKAKTEERAAAFAQDLEIANQRQKRINELVSDQNQEIDRLNSLNLQLSSSLRERDEELGHLAASLEAQVNEQRDLIKQKSELSWELDNLRMIEKKWKSDTEELQNAVQEAKNALIARQANDDTRNRQYRFFLENLNRSKKDLREQCSKLIQEMKASFTMNPMRDLLTATHRELSRVEIQLKRTPTISPDRVRLEECLTELIQQRDFLNQSLESSTSMVKQRIQRISEIMESDAGTMTPPPPPTEF